jgi:hypothetical protein
VAVSGKVIKYTTGAGQAAVPLRVVPNGDGSYALAVASPFVTPVALSSPPATLTAGANTLTFASAVTAIDLGNSSGVDVRYRVGGAAGPGSDPVRAGSSGTVSVSGGTTTISLYVPSGVALNDPTTAENVNVGGRA